MRVDELEQDLATYCHALARGNTVYTDSLTDFLDEEAASIADTDEDRPAALAEVKERFPNVAKLDALYRNDRERFDDACRRVEEEGTREWGVIERVLNEADNGGTMEEINLAERKRPLLVDSLKPEWKKFVIAFVNGASQREAYHAAYPGVKDSTAHVNGWKLLQKTVIRDAVDELLDEVSHVNYSRLRSLQNQALSKLAIAMNSENEETSLRAALEILNRTGMIARAGLELRTPERNWAETAALLDDEPDAVGIPD